MGSVATQPPDGSCTSTDWYQDQSAVVGRDMHGTVPPGGDSGCTVSARTAAKIAEILEEHHKRGWWSIHHVAAEIAAAVQLIHRPDPDVWANQAGGVTLRHHQDLVSTFTVKRAREIAAALLAAADDAEAQK